MPPVSLDLTRPVAASTLAATINLLDFRMPAGFPSPAEDHLVRRCDLVDLLSTHPQATYFMRVRGDSMIGVGIHDNDIVAVNRALQPKHGSIVVANVDNEFTCKTLFQRNGRIRLVAANPAYPDIRPKEGQTIEVWGVVTAALTLFRN
jgi:DNA polymerase V